MVAKFLNSEVFRFLVVGVANTLNYYVLYLLFNYVFHINYLTAHITAFIISMIGSFYLNSYYTYRSRPSLSKFLKFPLTYVVNIAISTVSIYILVDLLEINETVSPLIATLIAIPFTFVISKKILKT
ncbi:GtrA family protein [Planococcus lenghuensis]|uniref:Polysaccharide biosynthesis protein n=1 Tax=Planococcus lenghuensis TaxID=2213202 RepID=A0A1Q2L102_9BACL|nr:GtrA family protein [Planococcus lenghuensis]AQQ54054.1 polysaccharide biosynthesis protein [Planococcus lenghuensis]